MITIWKISTPLPLSLNYFDDNRHPVSFFLVTTPITSLLHFTPLPPNSKNHIPILKERSMIIPPRNNNRFHNKPINPSHLSLDLRPTSLFPASYLHYNVHLSLAKGEKGASCSSDSSNCGRARFARVPPCRKRRRPMPIDACYNTRGK